MRWQRRLTITLAAMTLSACAGSPQAIETPAASSPQGRTTAQATESRKQFYVAEGNDVVYIKTYPDGGKVGSISLGYLYSPDAECTDAAGNIWVAGSSGYFSEYARSGGKPLAKLVYSKGLSGCSVDPTTGNLAAVNGNMVLVWHNAEGKPVGYHTQWDYVLKNCGFDDHGNLFADGFDEYRTPSFLLFELPQGGSKLEQLKLDVKINGAGQVQWDGSYITIQEQQSPGDIYRLKVAGTTATVVGTVRFNGLASSLAPSWIQGGAVLVPSGHQLRIYDYPAGGNATETLKGKTYNDDMTAVTVSVVKE
jgi:hypothetical protein